MRWPLIVCVGVLAACQQLQPTAPPTALPGPAPTGKPTAPITVAGQTWEPCVKRQMKQYPPVLDRPSNDYYAGGWCQPTLRGNRYLWTYARPMTAQQTPEHIRELVNVDGGQLARALRATGYQTIEQSDKNQDVYFEARRPTSPNVVVVSVIGDNPPPAGQSYAGDDPLRLLVEVRPAGPEDTPSPSP